MVSFDARDIGFLVMKYVLLVVGSLFLNQLATEESLATTLTSPVFWGIVTIAFVFGHLAIYFQLFL